MTVTILGRLSPGGDKLPLYSFRVPAGFPSPAADHIEKNLSMDELFNIRAPHVYLAKIEGESMQGAGIFDRDIVVVNRSLTAVHGDIVIAALNSELICKRLHMLDNICMLTSENSKYPPRHVIEGDDLMIWGVVKYSVRDHDNS